MSYSNKTCILCNNNLIKTIFHGYKCTVYRCNKCEISPYSKFTLTHDIDDKLIAYFIALLINNQYYALTSFKNISKTVISSLISESNIDGTTFDYYNRTELCTLNYFTPLVDVASAEKAISKYLKLIIFS
jgi:hypothetical protein